MTQIDHKAILDAAFKYIAAHQAMEAATRDGVNVHGAVSGIIGATDNLIASFPTTQPPQQDKQDAGWQPIETAPKDGTSVLIANDAPGSVHPREGYYVQPARRFSDEPVHLGWWRLAGSCAERIHGRTPTHWMPLPPSPFSAATKDSK